MTDRRPPRARVKAVEALAKAASLCHHNYADPATDAALDWSFMAPDVREKQASRADRTLTLLKHLGYELRPTRARKGAGKGRA